MISDPYKTPDSESTSTQEPDKVKMPFVLKITTAFIGLMLLLNIVAIVEVFPNYRISVGFFMGMFSVALSIATIVMMIMRISWGRWLAIFVLVIHLIHGVSSNNPDENGPLKLYDPNGFGAIAGEITYYLIFVILIYKLIFSTKVKEYFGEIKN